MRDCEIKAVMNMKFDPIKEKDIISEIQELTAHRKFGGYIENLLRFAAEHRKEMETMGFDNDMRGSTDARKQMFNCITDEINEMRKKVDAVLNTVLSIKTAFELGKAAGVERQVDNALAAQIVLQIQMNKLSNLVGSPLQTIDIEKYKDDVESIAENAVKIANERYGEMISELANMYNQVLSLKEQCQISPILVSANAGVVGNNVIVAEKNESSNSLDGYNEESKGIERNDGVSSNEGADTKDEVKEAVVEISSSAVSGAGSTATFTDDLDGLAALFGR